MPAPKRAPGGSRSPTRDDLLAERRDLRARLEQEQAGRREAQRLQAPLLDELREEAARLARAEEALKEEKSKGNKARRAELRTRLRATENVRSGEHGEERAEWADERARLNESLREAEARERAAVERMSERHEEQLQARERAHAEMHRKTHEEQLQAHAGELREFLRARDARLQALESACADKLQAHERRHAQRLQESRAEYAEELQVRERAFADQLRAAEAQHAEELERQQRECDDALRAALRAEQGKGSRTTEARKQAPQQQGTPQPVEEPEDIVAPKAATVVDTGIAGSQVDPAHGRRAPHAEGVRGDGADSHEKSPEQRPCISGPRSPPTADEASSQTKKRAASGSTENAKRPCAVKSVPPARPRWLRAAPRAVEPSSPPAAAPLPPCSDNNDPEPSLVPPETTTSDNTEDEAEYNPFSTGPPEA